MQEGTFYTSIIKVYQKVFLGVFYPSIMMKESKNDLKKPKTFEMKG
jgi:hypothetical protein